MRPVSLVLMGALLGGCYRVPVEVRPTNATLVDREGQASGVPTTLRVTPLRGQRVEVSAPDHRTYVLWLSWRLGEALSRHREVTIHLVEDHPTLREGEEGE
jgi:hypothetical protein